MEILVVFLKTFVGIFAVMDPIGAIPVLVGITAGNTEAERRRMVLRASLVALGVLLFFGVTQMWLFSFFGFTMGAFRVAGGLFLFLIAFEMLTAKSLGSRSSDEEQAEGATKEDISITPLAVPMLAGPATITNVVLAFSEAQTIEANAIVVLALVLVCLASWLILRGSTRIASWLGNTGIKVVTRMMGLLLAAMSIQVIADGMLELFPGLAT